ncbi:MAG: FGGY family carbohydrate kinase [Rhizomicrobium sp.]
MFLGIDIGNSKLKLCLLDTNGNVKASRSTSLASRQYRTLSNAKQWTPDRALGSLGRATRQFCDTSGIMTSQIEFLCISATAPDFWFLPSPVSPPRVGIGAEVADPLSVDQPEVTRLLQESGAESIWNIECLVRAQHIRRHTSGVPSGAYYQTKHAWLFSCLTGLYALDAPTATELGVAYDVSSDRWRRELFEGELGAQIALPDVVRVGTLSGVINGEWLPAFGFRPGAKAVLGSCDSFCSMLGAGCLDDDDLFVYYGTYFCAARTWLKRFLIQADERRPPFRWAHSLPFAGRILEDVLCALYGQTPNRSFEFLERDIKRAGSNALNVTGVVNQIGRPRFIWEDTEFSVTNIGRDIHRYQIGIALMRAMGTDLSVALRANQISGRIYASGGGTQSDAWLSAISSTVDAEQRLLADRDEGVGTAFLAHFLNDPVGSMQKLEDRRRDHVAYAARMPK